MDPDAAYELMIAAFRAEDHEEARDAALNLVRWINRGGFAPEYMTRAEARGMAGIILADARECIKEARRGRREAS